MQMLEEPTRLILEEYQRRFRTHIDVPIRDLDVETRGKFIAALERALQRNLALSDYELMAFELSLRRRLWLSAVRVAHRVAGRN
jgi:hypothetical protein